MGERVVGGLALGLLEEEAGLDGGREIVGERIVAARARGLALSTCRRRRDRRPRRRTPVAVTDSRPDRPEVAQAEAAAQDRRVAEHRARPARAAAPRGGR